MQFVEAAATGKVYITQPILPEAVAFLRARLTVQLNPEKSVLSKKEFIKNVGDIDGLVTLLTDTVDAEILEAAPRLKVVANVAVGFNNIDVSAATRLGIAVTNTPGVLTETSADFAWTLMMAAARRLGEAERFTRQGKFQSWDLQMFLGNDIYGKTLGIIGFGRIGQAVARRAQGFGMRIVFVNRSVVPVNVMSSLGAEAVSLDELLSISDFISLHVPLNPETRHLLNDSAFERMRPGCIVVNTSRGPVIDEKALARALKTKRIAAAGLDVYEHEPQIEPELLQLENVVLAPHIGSASRETRLRMCMMAAENLTSVLRQERPANLVNSEVWANRRQ